MNAHHEVISAFIDGEPFDAHELGTALATADGREMLLDLIALGHVVGADVATESKAGIVTRRSPWRALAAAAVVVLALGGGYLAGHRTASESPTTMPPVTPATMTASAPAPTRVIEVDTWQHREGGR